MERSRKEDFGYGWKLTLGNPRLEVNPANDVTLTTLDGKRVTFYFTPHYNGILPFGEPAYTAEPGVYGELWQNDCFVVSFPLAGGYTCYFGGSYRPNSYSYRDPYGRVYHIRTSDGKLDSLLDLNGNQLLFNDDGIVSNNGATGVCKPGDPTYIVCFGRDSTHDNRIQAITDTLGNVYKYDYAPSSGDLISVTMPGIAPLGYSYYAGDQAHFFKEAFGPQGNRLVLTQYDTDNRLLSVTDPVSNTTSYKYDGYTEYNGPHHNIITTTNPDMGKQAIYTDDYGKVEREVADKGAAPGSVQSISLKFYDNLHQLIWSKDYSSLTDYDFLHSFHYIYDDRGHHTFVQNILTSPANAITTTYNAYSGPAAITNQENQTSNVSYDDNYMPLVVTDSVGTMGGYAFDSRGSVLTRSDANNHPTNFTYDAYGNKTSEADALGNRTGYSYDAMGRVTFMTDALGIASRYEYDAIGHLITSTQAYTSPNAMRTIFAYDLNGNKVSTTDALNHITRYGYDAANRMTVITYATGITQGYTYDWRGNKTSETDQSGVMTQYTYDLAGRLTKTTYAANKPEAASQVVELDILGRKVKEYNTYAGSGSLPSNQPYVQYDYDSDDKLINLTDQTKNKTTYIYDKAGRLLSETDALTHTTSYIYDERGRLITTTYPIVGGVTISTTQHFDGAGNLINKTDGAGQTTIYNFDVVNRLQAVVNPLRQTTNYQYDALSRMQIITDANTHQTQFKYDELGRQTDKIMSGPAQPFEHYTYDAVGNRKTQRLSDGTTNTFSYDVLNRLQGANFQDGRTVVYTYTAVGQRQAVTDSKYGTTNYIYDGRERISRITQPSGQWVEYGYDERNNRKSLTTSAASTGPTTWTYQYFDDNLLSTIKDSQGAAVKTYFYDNARRTVRTDTLNGVSQYNNYDAMNRLTGITHIYSNLSTLAVYSYTLDGANNRTAVTETLNYKNTSTPTTRLLRYTYDPANRLTAEWDSTLLNTTGLTTTYQYDAVGNRLSMQTDAATPTTYTYNELDQLTTMTATNGVIGQYSYQRGNLIGISTNDGQSANSYNWDSADRLVAATAAGNRGSASYLYDADGRRVQQTITGQSQSSTNYLWDEASQYGDVLLETDAVSGAFKTGYIMAGNELVAQKRSSDPSYIEYFHKDGLGSTRALINDSFSLVDTNNQSYNYTVFGGMQNQPSQINTSYLYTSQQFDPLTSLYDLRARYYNPGDGRFLSQDKWAVNVDDPTELNRYLYTANNPANYSDPSGYGFVDSVLLHFKLNRATYTLGLSGGLTVLVLLAAIILAISTAQLKAILNHAVRVEPNGVFPGSGDYIYYLNHDDTVAIADLFGLWASVLSWLGFGLTFAGIGSAAYKFFVGLLLAIPGITLAWPPGNVSRLSNARFEIMSIADKNKKTGKIWVSRPNYLSEPNKIDYGEWS